MNRYAENVTFACTSKQREEITRRAKSMGVPKSVLIREAVLAYLEDRPMRSGDVLREEHEQLRSHGRSMGGTKKAKRAREQVAEEQRPKQGHPWRNNRILGRDARGEV